MTTHQKACLVFTDNFVDPETGVVISKTTWADAWDVGLLYGLFVYPLGWLINLFVVFFGSTGWAQIGAILVVTVILKLLILLLTFKSQTSTQKMQDIQPEILKIQSKYGPTPTPEEKQRMSMELMNVYQKYGVKPFAPFASLLITFPVFIAMYRAVMFLGVLRTGNIGGVILGVNLSEYIIGGKAFNYVALIIFLLMAASQVLSMKLPQILNRKRMTREAKQQQKQTSMMTNMMMIMILVMGFMMPATMSIYWVASAVVGMIQSIIMHKVNNGSKNGKYKVKTAEREVAKIPQGYKK
jgi:YidC/Oxa1 family membrane protein insertase